jgi:raffinose/stachyose/melibiose transport system substrate-binding protein
MMARRLWQLSAMVTAGILAAGCSSGGQHTAASSGHQKVTITMWNDVTGTPPPRVPKSKFWFNEAIQLFERQNPDIHVKIIPTPDASSTGFATLLKSSEVAGNTPDVGELFAGGQVVQNAQYLLKLNSYISPQFRHSLYIGWQFVTDGFRLNGPIYGVPYGAGYWYFVYYNKALLKKAGVTSSSFPTTWPGLIAMAQKIKAGGITPFIFGEKEGYFGAWTQDALISGQVGTNGVLQMNSGKESLNSPPIVKSYEAWHELYADGLTNNDALSLQATQGIARFAAGKGAMTITGGFYNAQIEEGLGAKVGIFPVPALPGSTYPNTLSGGPNNSYVIFKNTQHPQQAMKLVTFLTSPTVQKLAVNGGLGQLPNNRAYVAAPSLAKKDPILAQTYNFIRVKHYMLAEAFDNIMPGSIDSYWYQTNSGAFGGSLSPSAAASNLQQQMQTYLQTNQAGAG